MSNTIDTTQPTQQIHGSDYFQSNRKTITISRYNWDRLKKRGHYGLSTYDSIIGELLDDAEGNYKRNPEGF